MVFMQNKKIEDVMKSIAMLVEELSHELVNKVATLQMKQQGMDKVFPVLMQGYNVAVQNNLVHEKLSKRILDGISDLSDLNEQLAPMLEALDRINQYIEAISKPQKDPEYSIRQCIQHVLAQAPFNSSDRLKKIQVMVHEECCITYPRLFVEAALHHILHGLFDVESADAVKISLSEEQNILTIIGYQVEPQQSRTSIFNHYIHEPYDKSYPGLGLCRLAFHVLGGDILIKRTDKCEVEYQLVIGG